MCLEASAEGSIRGVAPFFQHFRDFRRHVVLVVAGQNLVGLEQPVRANPAVGDDALPLTEQVRQDAGIGHGNRSIEVGHVETNFQRTGRAPHAALFDQPADAQAPPFRRLRVGGLVEQGSVRRTPGSLEVRFDVTDLDQTITVAYAGVLPDLFREGQGVVAHGWVGADGLFEADEVLARHDENYMPPEVAEMLEERGHPPDASLR